MLQSCLRRPGLHAARDKKYELALHKVLCCCEWCLLCRWTRAAVMMNRGVSYQTPASRHRLLLDVHFCVQVVHN